MDISGLTALQLQQLKEALDQGGLAGGGKLAGGLVLGSGADGPGAGAGDVRLSGSIRESVTLGAGVYRGSAQTIPDSLVEPVSFSDEWFDSDCCWDVANPTRLTVRTGGVYCVYGNVVWVNSAAGYRFLAITLNGNSRYIALCSAVAVAGVGPFMNVSGLFFLNEGDYVELRVFQTTGSPLDIGYAGAAPWAYQPEFGMARVA